MPTSVNVRTLVPPCLRRWLDAGVGYAGVADGDVGVEEDDDVRPVVSRVAERIERVPKGVVDSRRCGCELRRAHDDLAAEVLGDARDLVGVGRADDARDGAGVARVVDRVGDNGPARERQDIFRRHADAAAARGDYRQDLGSLLRHERLLECASAMLAIVLRVVPVLAVLAEREEPVVAGERARRAAAP